MGIGHRRVPLFDATLYISREGWKIYLGDTNTPMTHCVDTDTDYDQIIMLIM